MTPSGVVTPTEIGAEYFQLAQEALNRFEIAETAIRRKTNNIEGTVTVSCSVGMAQFALFQILPRFLQENPRVRVVQQASNRIEDLIKGGIDVAIRGHMETLPDSSLLQVRLAHVEWHLLCSTDYRDSLERTDDPATLTEWTIPADTVLQPGESVFFDAFNFGISADGEELFLTRSDGFTVESKVAFGNQRADVPRADVAALLRACLRALLRRAQK